jgi:hypothetical protein
LQQPHRARRSGIPKGLNLIQRAPVTVESLDLLVQFVAMISVSIGLLNLFLLQFVEFVRHDAAS